MRTITITSKEHVRAILKVLFLITLIVIFAIMTSCESKSGQLTQQRVAIPLEKVVIIDSKPSGALDEDYHYKVKRLSSGTVIWISEPNQYEKGDTLLKRIYTQ